jgi:hypothetical protein
MGRWFAEIQENADSQIATIPVGNKTDHEELRRVGFKAEKILAECENRLFIEPSANYPTNISRAFEMLTAEVIARYKQGVFDCTPSAQAFQLKLWVFVSGDSDG